MILYVADLLRWADEHRKRTGKFPQAKSGIVAACPAEKWTSIDHNLRLGQRGLPANWSLAQLLTDFRGHRNNARLPNHTLKDILAWADAYHKRLGQWPTQSSGAIPVTAEHWKLVDGGLRRGLRGLPSGSSLARLLNLHRGVRRYRHSPGYSIQQILEWADDHKKLTGR